MDMGEAVLSALYQVLDSPKSLAWEELKLPSLPYQPRAFVAYKDGLRMAVLDSYRNLIHDKKHYVLPKSGRIAPRLDNNACRMYNVFAESDLGDGDVVALKDVPTSAGALQEALVQHWWPKKGEAVLDFLVTMEPLVLSCFLRVWPRVWHADGGVSPFVRDHETPTGAPTRPTDKISLPPRPALPILFNELIDSVVVDLFAPFSSLFPAGNGYVDTILEASLAYGDEFGLTASDITPEELENPGGEDFCAWKIVTGREEEEKEAAAASGGNKDKKKKPVFHYEINKASSKTKDKDGNPVVSVLAGVRSNASHFLLNNPHPRAFELIISSEEGRDLDVPEFGSAAFLLLCDRFGGEFGLDLRDVFVGGGLGFGAADGRDDETPAEGEDWPELRYELPAYVVKLLETLGDVDPDMAEVRVVLTALSHNPVWQLGFLTLFSMCAQDVMFFDVLRRSKEKAALLIALAGGDTGKGKKGKKNKKKKNKKSKAKAKAAASAASKAPEPKEPVVVEKEPVVVEKKVEPEAVKEVVKEEKVKEKVEEKVKEKEEEKEDSPHFVTSVSYAAVAQRASPLVSSRPAPEEVEEMSPTTKKAPMSKNVVDPVVVKAVEIPKARGVTWADQLSKGSPVMSSSKVSAGPPSPLASSSTPASSEKKKKKDKKPKKPTVSPTPVPKEEVKETDSGRSETATAWAQMRKSSEKERVAASQTDSHTAVGKKASKPVEKFPTLPGCPSVVPVVREIVSPTISSEVVSGPTSAATLSTPVPSKDSLSPVVSSDEAPGSPVPSVVPGSISPSPGYFPSSGPGVPPIGASPGMTAAAAAGTSGVPVGAGERGAPPPRFPFPASPAGGVGPPPLPQFVGVPPSGHHHPHHPPPLHPHHHQGPPPGLMPPPMVLEGTGEGGAPLTASASGRWSSPGTPRIPGSPPSGVSGNVIPGGPAAGEFLEDATHVGPQRKQHLRAMLGHLQRQKELLRIQLAHADLQVLIDEYAAVWGYYPPPLPPLHFGGDQLVGRQVGWSRSRGPPPPGVGAGVGFPPGAGGGAPGSFDSSSGAPLPSHRNHGAPSATGGSTAPSPSNPPSGGGGNSKPSKKKKKKKKK